LRALLAVVRRIRPTRTRKYEVRTTAYITIQKGDTKNGNRLVNFNVIVHEWIESRSDVDERLRQPVPNETRLLTMHGAKRRRAAAETTICTNVKNSEVDKSVLVNAVSSAAAGIVSRLFTHPLDTAKARLQALDAATQPPSTSYRGPLDVLRRTIQSEGLVGLYRGFPAVIVGGTPGTVLYLCSYDVLKKQLQQRWDGRTGNESFLVHFASGMMAETIACVIYVPVDVVKERMQVQHRIEASTSQLGRIPQYRGSWDALKTILRTEGLSGIYRGYGATLASFGPFSAIYFVLYEQLKVLAKEYLDGKASPPPAGGELPFGYILASSATAGAMASFITSPLDMAKLRLQVQRGQMWLPEGQTVAPSSVPGSAQLYRGFVDCLQATYKIGGIRALFRGAGARVLHFAPAVTVTMTCYESCRAFVSKLLQ
jgi:Mitochondrial carrier protein